MGNVLQGEAMIMRSWRYLLFAIACAVGFPHDAHADKRVALVIGNAGYVNANPLANPSNDAGDVAAKLKSLGFEVILGRDLDKRNFDAKLRQFSSALDAADTALLFYAGHGLQIAGHNYLIPVDAKLERERDVEFEAISLDFVLKQMELGYPAIENGNFAVGDESRRNRAGRWVNPKHINGSAAADRCGPDRCIVSRNQISIRGRRDRCTGHSRGRRQRRRQRCRDEACQAQVKDDAGAEIEDDR